LRFFRFFF